MMDLVSLSKRPRAVRTLDRVPSDAARLSALLEAPQPGLRRGVHFQLHTWAVAYESGAARLVDACGYPDARRLAVLAAAVSDFFGNVAPFTVVLALVSLPKRLVYSRPLRMSDINGGATFHDRRLCVLWRLDADLEKVLLHELVHLFGNSTAPLAVDEALTEATALRMWCALHGVPLAVQVRHTAELAAKVAHTDHRATNAWAYTGGALAALSGRDVRAPPRVRPTAPWADETFTATVPPSV